METNGYEIKPGAKLTEADLGGANLTGVRANQNTTWQEGFDPVAAGVIFDKPFRQG